MDKTYDGSPEVDVVKKEVTKRGAAERQVEETAQRFRTRNAAVAFQCVKGAPDLIRGTQSNTEDPIREEHSSRKVAVLDPGTRSSCTDIEIRLTLQKAIVTIIVQADEMLQPMQDLMASVAVTDKSTFDAVGLFEFALGNQKPISDVSGGIRNKRHSEGRFAI